MRLRCAILDDYQNVSQKLADWSGVSQKTDITVFNKPFASTAEAIAELQDFEIICAMRERTPFGKDVLGALPKLKLLVTSGMRNAAIDLPAAKERGIVVSGTGGVGNPTAGLAIGLMLELTRHIGYENARMKAGEPWQTTVGMDPEGKVFGVVGLGKLGSKVSEIAKALGMKVLAWSTNLTPEACAAAGVEYATKEQLFAQSDVISVHVVLSARSRGLIGRDDLRRMKPTSYIINTARAPIIDEDALIEVLREKKIAGAGLDVFPVEPLPLDHPFRALDNVVLTPHIGYVTEETYRRFYGESAENVIAWLDGKPIRVLT